MNQTVKYGLFFLGGVTVGVIGAIGAASIARGKFNVKSAASDLLSSGMDIRDKVLAGVEDVKEELADVMAEAQVKAQERREAKEAEEAAAAAPAAADPA